MQILPLELQEAELFVYGFTFLSLLIVGSSGLSGDLLHVLKIDMGSDGAKKGGSVYFIAMLIIGAFVAVYVALSRQSHGDFVKSTTKFFFVLTNAILAIMMGMHTLNNPTTFNYILTTWQFFQGIALLFFTGQETMGDYYDMPQRDARRNEILLGILVVLAVIGVSIVYQWYWVATFSIILFVWRTAYSTISRMFGVNFFLNSPIVGKN